MLDGMWAGTPQVLLYRNPTIRCLRISELPFGLQNVVPDPTKHCGPYSPAHDLKTDSKLRYNKYAGPHNHDTIGMVALDTNNNVASGTSTNGAGHKIPG